VPVSTVLQAQGPVLLIASVMGAAVWALRLALEPFLNSVVLLGVLVACGGIVYAGLVLKFLPASVPARLRGVLQGIGTKKNPTREIA
jgi:hypothetical protein